MKPIIALLAALLLTASLRAKNIDKYHEEIQQMSLADNLASPAIPRRQLSAIQQHMHALAQRLQRSGLTVDITERDGAVVCVTIPMAQLFMANDTVLTTGGCTLLSALPPQLHTPDAYKIIVAAHSDDTGSEEYLNAFTAMRAEAVAVYLASHGVSAPSIVPYGLGFDEPISVAPSRRGRAQNRRLEIYLVPGPTLLK